jgi:hypothetical protein
MACIRGDMAVRWNILVLFVTKERQYAVVCVLFVDWRRDYEGADNEQDCLVA